MCGIAGVVSNCGDAFNKINTLLKFIISRGPDAQKIQKIEQNLFLAHSRLSIIDLNVRSNQPMKGRDDISYIVFNGEIYNFKELKNTYLNSISFKTQGDTEVLLEGIIKYGFNFLEKIRGFFSFAFYDKKKNKIFLARDPIGKKPLYYYHFNEEFYFSSDLHGLSKIILEKHRKNINFYGLSHYLWKGYFHDENTIYKNIKSVIPGEVLEYDLKKKRLITIKKNKSTSFSFKKIYNSKKIKNLLIEAIKYRKVSDVNISYLLSGGIDSSLICKLASEDEIIDTYYAYTKKDQSQFDELSNMVSKNIKSNHNILEIDNLDLEGMLKKNFQIFHEPFADYSSIPSYLIYEKISKKTKVAISGDGADEVFGGYQDYKIFFLKDLLKGFKLNINLSSIYKLFDELKIIPKKYLYLLFSIFLKEGDLYNLLFNGGWNLHFREKYMHEISFKNSFNSNIENDIKKKFIDCGKSSLERSFNSYLERLKFDFMVKVDRTSMINALEVRCPFLDSNIFKEKKNTNPKKMVDLFSSKKELKHELNQLGLGFINKFKKRGFSIPLHIYLCEKKNRELINTLLDQNSIVMEHFKKEKIETMISNESNIKQNFFRIWILLVLNFWHEKTTR